jgi:hypothetical protein
MATETKYSWTVAELAILVLLSLEEAADLIARVRAESETQ